MDVNDRRLRATEEAAYWWTRLGTNPPADVSETDRQEFTQWLRDSPLHVAELLHVAHAHDALERFKLWDEIPLETQYDADNVTEFPVPFERDRKAGRVESFRRDQRRSRWLLAASVAVTFLFVGWLMLRTSNNTLQTDRAERREVVLADGSVVSLEPETTLQVNLGKRERNIVLSHGRALFHVAKDASRPFIVHAGNTRVRAVGTVFGVEQKNQSIVVTVSEGRVAVVPTVSETPSGGTSSSSSFTAFRRATVVAQPAGEPDHGNTIRSATQSGAGTRLEHGAKTTTNSGDSPAGGDPNEVLLAADEQLTVQRSGRASSVARVDANQALAWSEGRLVFDSTPLREVAEEFNRYNRAQLRIQGEALEARTISGVFKASDPQTLIDFISAGTHAVVRHNGPEEIVISPEP